MLAQVVGKVSVSLSRSVNDLRSDIISASNSRGTDLDVLLQILRTLEALCAELTSMRLQWNVNSDVRGDVIAFNRGGAAGAPSADQGQVVGALPADMTLADVILATSQIL